ncbi:polysaccharide deacetylase family protein [Nocardioides sp. Bht2]|uniref:polysaccharide deacetylase family protein n=1 Tax=Nocardioides sp. Bht2 TaxID=3392297 RepID=UPI0039B6B027
MQARVLVLLLACALMVAIGQPILREEGAATTASRTQVEQAPSAEGDTDSQPEVDGGLATDDDAHSKPPVSKKPQPAEFEPVDCTKKRCVALSFDDGPSLPTPRLLDILKNQKVPATFFLVGQMVKWHPKTTARISREGHEVGVHGWNHADLRRLKPKDLDWQLHRTKQLIQQATGIRPTLCRPPYGASNKQVLKAEKRAGLAEVLWNIDTQDWKIRNAKHVRNSVLNHVKRNTVVLMHDIRPTTVDAIPQMVRELKRRGFTLVTVTQLFGTTKPGVSYLDWR